MPRGHNKKADMSAARWAAKKAPALYSSAAKPSAKPTTISDQRPSQRLEHRRQEVVPEWAKLQKDEHEKIAGTRVQCLAGGIAVRVILEDGTKFPPHKALAAKRYLRKLAAQKKEKDEIKRMIDQSNFNSSEPSADGMEVAAAAPSTSTSASSSAAEPGSKKARKEAAWKERQQQLAAIHAAKVQEDGRELVSQQVYQGEVVHRTQGRVYVKSREVGQMPEVVLSKLRAATAEIRSEMPAVDGELLPICFPDVVQVGLDLKPGVAVEFKVFTDKHGVGGCEAKASSKIEKRPASEAAEAGSPQKRQKSAPMEDVIAATPGQDRLAAEAAAKAKAEETRLASEAAAKPASAPTAASPAKQTVSAADKTPIGTPNAASEQATPDSVKSRLRAKTRLSPSPSP